MGWQTNKLKITTNMKKANFIRAVCHMLQLHLNWAPLWSTNIWKMALQ